MQHTSQDIEELSQFFNRDILIPLASLLPALLMNRNNKMAVAILPSENEEDLQNLQKRNESGIMKRHIY